MRRGHIVNFPKKELYAYTGLEIASSPNEMPVIQGIWSQKMFAGIPYFQTVMSRDRLKQIRSALRSSPSYDLEHAK